MLATVTNALADVLGAIAWSPEIRNILSVLVGVGVLCGSVYLLVATNTGIRTGMLVTLAGLFGWMAIMGVIWWIYGIGMLGRAASWEVEEVNYSAPDFGGLEEASNAEVRDLTALEGLPTAQDILDERPELVDEILPPDLEPDVREARAANITLGQIIEVAPEIVEEYGFEEALGGWELLAQSDRQRGDAVATADTFLGEEGRGLFESAADYIVLDAFAVGGKDGLPDDPDRLDRIVGKLRSIFVEPLHPAHYTVVQVRAVEHVEPVPGEPPPIPVVDEDEPIISVVMIRDLGDKRFPAFMITVIFGTLFAVTCWVLHRRDAVVAARRAATV